MAEDLDRLTPNVNREWREQFVMELRLAGTPGARIGDALATVDAHCAESGESTDEAFGDPVSYARELLGEETSRIRLRPRLIIGLTFGLLSMLTLPRAVEDWAQDERFTVTAGDLVTTVSLALLAGLLFWRPEPLLGWFYRHPATSFSLPFAVLIAMLVPAALLQGAVVVLEWQTPAVLGLGALMLSVALTWPDLSQPDPIVDPRDDRSTRAGRDPMTWMTWMTVLMFPVLVAIMIGYDALVRALL